MKQFVIRVILFTVLFVFIKQTINAFSPYYWGNPWFASKVNYLETEIDSLPNVFFFGSSRVYRQIDPLVFDDTYHRLKDKTLHSFNLGAPATFNPQSYYLYRNFLNSELSRNTELVFMELTSIDLISDDLIYQERTSYWLNTSDISYAIRAIINHPKLPVTSKLKGVQHYFTSYVSKFLSIDYFGKEILGRNNYDKTLIGSKKNGFYPLDYNLENTKDSVIFNNLVLRRKMLLNNPSNLKSRAEKSVRIRQNDFKRNYNITLNKALSFIELSENQGVELIFIIMPRNINMELLSIANQIPPKNVIDLSNANMYPELYQTENSFDIGHLNLKGSEILTRLLVQQFLSSSSKNN